MRRADSASHVIVLRLGLKFRLILAFLPASLCLLSPSGRGAIPWAVANLPNSLHLERARRTRLLLPSVTLSNLPDSHALQLGTARCAITRTRRAMVRPCKEH